MLRLKFTRSLTSLLAMFLCVAVSPLSAQPLDENSLPFGIRLVVDGHGLPLESYGLLVREIGAVEPVLAVNADVPFNPASTMKVVTTYAALELLGPTYTWDTRVYTMGPIDNGTLKGDLVIKGGGDPFLVEEDFRALLKTLQRRGVQNIEGDLVLDGAYFDPSVSMQRPLDEQVARAYNVIPNAVLSNFQAVTFYFSPAPDNANVVVRADPPLPNLVINNRLRLRSGACRGYQRGISFNEDPAAPGTVFLEGLFPSGCGEYQLVRAVLDPASYTYGLFSLLWHQLGGEFQGNLRQDTLPLDAQPLFTWYSRPLTDIIESINKNSNNMMARQVLLTIGAERLGEPATVDKGELAIRDFLDGEGIETDTLVIDNGAGLSRVAQATPATLGHMLDHAWTSPLLPEFLASLPLAGFDGTMRNRLRGTPAGSIRIKTGSLDDVAAIAGYVQGRSGKTYVVSGMVNHELADEGPGTELLDAVLTWASDQ